MSEPILDPNYWRSRMKDADARGEDHLAVFRCPLDRWRRIEAKHRQILAHTIGDRDSILDCGCGWGRLLSLLPASWDGAYLGVDLSPDFVKRAHLLHPTHDRRTDFVPWDLRELGNLGRTFDWAVLISIRPMVKRNLGDEEWVKMEDAVRSCCRNLLYLEYDEADEGSVE